MKAEWKNWSAQFAARTPREKKVLALAALALLYVAADAIWLTPTLNALKAEHKVVAQRTAELAQVQAQATQLSEQMRAQEQQTRAALETGRRDLGGVAAQLAEFEKTLVPARRMADFLRGLLPGAGIEVVSLKTLAPTPLIVRDTGKPADATALPSGAAVLPKSKDTANLYKHGVEITLAGSYPALLDYLNRLEQSPQKVLWGRLELRAEKYPRSELTLTLYTLSLDPSWLVV
jgi:MSHA biogenesis protein MshJ